MNPSPTNKRLLNPKLVKDLTGSELAVGVEKLSLHQNQKALYQGCYSAISGFKGGRQGFVRVSYVPAARSGAGNVKGGKPYRSAAIDRISIRLY